MYKVGNSALRTYTIGNWLLDVKRTNHSISWKEVWKSAIFFKIDKISILSHEKEK